MTDTSSHQEGDSGSAETGERRRKSEGAGAAFGRILLGKPECIDSKVRSSQTQKEETEEKPGEGARSEIENFTEGEGDEDHHESKEKGEGSASPNLFGEPWHGE